jgi:hypothetical protein
MYPNHPTTVLTDHRVHFMAFADVLEEFATPAEPFDMHNGRI